MDLESWVKKRGDMLGAEAGHLEQHFIFTEGRCYCRTLVGVEILHCDKDDTIL